MGALRTAITLSNGMGRNVKSISEIFIWRTEYTKPSGWMEYYASRYPPDQMDVTEDHTITGVISTHYTTPHVKFMHQYEDGAEICVARAILALEEAGMNA